MHKFYKIEFRPRQGHQHLGHPRRRAPAKGISLRALLRRELASLPPGPPAESRGHHAVREVVVHSKQWLACSSSILLPQHDAQVHAQHHWEPVLTLESAPGARSTASASAPPPPPRGVPISQQRRWRVAAGVRYTLCANAGSYEQAVFSTP